MAGKSEIPSRQNGRAPLQKKIVAIYRPGSIFRCTGVKPCLRSRKIIRTNDIGFSGFTKTDLLPRAAEINEICNCITTNLVSHHTLSCT